MFFVFVQLFYAGGLTSRAGQLYDEALQAIE